MEEDGTLNSRSGQIASWCNRRGRERHVQLYRLGDNCGASEMEDIEDSRRLPARILKQSPLTTIAPSFQKTKIKVRV